MNHRVLITISTLLVASIFAGGCRPGHTSGEAAGGPTQASATVIECLRKTVVVGIDRSGSYTALLPAAMPQVATLLRSRSCPGDVWMFRWIATDSYSDREIIFTVTVPTALVHCANPFDRRCRAQAAREAAAQGQLIEEAARRLEATRAATARITDYWGFFTKSSQLFSASPDPAVPKLLIVVGDLVDDAGRSLPLALTDVTVITMMFKSGHDAAAHLRLRKFWQDALTAAGAKTVVFGDPSQPLDAVWDAAIPGAGR